MRFMIRPIEENAKLTEQAMLEAMETAIPPATVKEVVQEMGLARQRQRKLSAEMGLLLAVAMNLFTWMSLRQVLVKLLKGFRYIWPEPEFVPASKGAISQLRYQLGAQPVVVVFHRVCQPMAQPETPGAYLCGLRLMAIDGTVEKIPDTSENERAFGRHHSDRGASAFPQLRGVYLSEVGTHGIVDAGFWPLHTSERVGGLRLLRSVGEGMLVMWDRGFHSFDMVQRTVDQGAHFLGRLPAHVQLPSVCDLSDGSFLAWLPPSDDQRRKRGQRMLVRVIEYTIDDPARPGYGERHRLITSLLDEHQAPALALACAYHERWEIELVIDEMDTHQRLANHPLRSQKPVGVIQELYGLLVAHYAVRRVMFDAAAEAGLDPDRLSFVNAVQIICDAIPEFQMTAPEHHPQLYQRLLRDVARYRLPERDHRCNPRVVKRKMSKFPLKRPQHRNPPRPTKSFRASVVMLN